VKADALAAQQAGAGRVLRLRAAVCKKDHGVAAGRSLVFFNPPADALFGQQALHEGQVGFAVLHTVGALAGVAAEQAAGHVAGHIGVPLPGGNGGVVGEHVFDDLDDALVLPHAAAQAVTQQRDPGLHEQALAGQAAVGMQ